jgi:AcrR family transcriptional regulator
LAQTWAKVVRVEVEQAAPARDVLAVRRSPGRPRDIGADQAILAATLDLLYKRGYSGLTVDDVALRSGVAKTTIYRRWPSKPVLVAAAVSDRAATDFQTPDTGSTRLDLLELVRSASAAFSGASGVILRTLIRESGQSDLLLALVQGIVYSRRQLYEAVIERAIARGDLPPDLDREMFIDLLMGPAWVRLIITESAMPEGMPDQIVDMALHGVLTHS